MLNNQPELNDLLCLTINDLRFFPGVRRLADIISQLKQDDGNDHFSTSNLHYDIKLGPPLFSATPILTNETKRLNSWFLKAQGGGAIGLSGIQAHDLIRYINNDVMEDDESINSIHVESIKPVYIHDMRFNHRDDALYYCRVNQLSPTLIHHTRTK